MSLILDALRKMEQERRSRRGSGQDLRPDVLRYRLATQPKKQSRYPLVIIAALLLSAGIGAGFWLNGNGDESERQAKQEAAPPSAAPAPAYPTSRTPPAAPAPVPAEAPAAVSSAPAAPPALPSESVSRPLALEPARPKTPRAAVAQPRRAPAAAPQPATTTEEPVASHVGASDIIISGIAYQDERRMRRAVLNGVLVGEGAQIAGARVVEIKETKVKLSRGGQIFEVPFSSGLQSR